MSVPLRPLLACAASLTATAALAQPPRPASGDVQQQASSFVQAYAAPTATLHQIARWTDPVCVQVTGLPPDAAAQVKGRVEDVAKGVGLAVGPADCVPHIEIVFGPNPQKVIDGVAARQEIFLGYEHRNDKSLRTVTRPIQAWYVTATVGSGHGNANTLFSFSNTTSGGAGFTTQTGARVTDDPDFRAPTGCGDNRFSSCLRSVFENVLVTVDTSKAQGKSVGLLSDYVAMLALSQPRANDRCNVLPSITDLFVADCGRPAPDGLTPADAAYLTALYTADPEGNALRQPSDIADRMGKILASAG